MAFWRGILVLILVGAACGSEGSKKGGGGPGEGALSLPDYEDGLISVPLHGQVRVEVRLDRSRAGDQGEIRLEIGGELPPGVLLAGNEAPRLAAGEEALDLYFLANEEVESLDAPVELELRAEGARYDAAIPFSLQVSALVTSREDSGQGSLRQLVESAPRIRENPTIRFAPWVFSAEGAPHVIELASPIAITESLAIEGPLGEEEPLVVLDGLENSQLIHVGSEEMASDRRTAEVRLRGLQFHKGFSDFLGGCVVNYLDLTVEDAVFTECRAIASDGMDGGGGGIYSHNDSSLRILRSRFVENGGGSGAGLAAFEAFVEISESEFRGNAAEFISGAILVYDSRLEIRDTKIVDNRASASGALGVAGGVLEIERTAFEGNRAEGAGGAILLDDYDGSPALAAISAGIFRNNVSHGDGGAIFLEDAEIELTNCTFVENEALAPDEASTEIDHRGGAIAALKASVDVKGSLFRGNHAGRGGAVFVKGGPLRMESSSVIENTATGWAGGIDLDDSQEAHVLNSTVANNEALLAGGIYVHFKTEAAIRFTTITGNVATGVGDEDGSTTRPGPVGGLALANATLEMAATIIAANEATGDLTNDIWIEPDGANTATFETKGYNFVGDVAGSGKLLEPIPLLRADRSDLSGMGASALDPELEELQEMADLVWAAPPRASSPVVDHIPKTDCHALTEVDQRGASRPVGEACDIGAVERSE